MEVAQKKRLHLSCLESLKCKRISNVSKFSPGAINRQMKWNMKQYEAPKHLKEYHCHGRSFFACCSRQDTLN